MAALDVRVPDVTKARVAVYRQGDDGGVVAGGRPAQGGVAVAVEPEGRGAEVHLGGIEIPEPLGREQAGRRVDGLVLHLRVEGGFPLRQPHDPQVVVAELLRPQHLGPLQHLLAVLAEEGQGGLFPVRVGQVREQPLPVSPQGRGGVGQDGLVLAALEARVFQQARQQGIVVQDGADHQDVRVAVPGLAHRLPEPVGGFAPLLGGADALVVLDVVAEDQVRAALIVPPAPELLAAAHGVDAAAAREDDGGGLPGLARLLPEVGQNALIGLQLVLDGVQEADGLGLRVRHQQDVPLVAVQGGVEDVLQAHHRALGVAPGGGHGGPGAFVREHGLPVGQGVPALHHPAAPQLRQLPVEGRRGPGTVVGQVIFAKFRRVPGRLAEGLGVLHRRPPASSS